jgi:hypothetical protein
MKTHGSGRQKRQDDGWRLDPAPDVNGGIAERSLIFFGIFFRLQEGDRTSESDFGFGFTIKKDARRQRTAAASDLKASKVEQLR